MCLAESSLSRIDSRIRYILFIYTAINLPPKRRLNPNPTNRNINQGLKRDLGRPRRELQVLRELCMLILAQVRAVCFLFLARVFASRSTGSGLEAGVRALAQERALRLRLSACLHLRRDRKKNFCVVVCLAETSISRIACGIRYI